MRASLIGGQGETLSSAPYAPNTPLDFDGYVGSAVAIRLGEYVVTPGGEIAPPLGVVPLRAAITMADEGRVTASVTMTVVG